jgi:mannosyl-oligosaccharide alpha-1,2-mannosidase
LKGFNTETGIPFQNINLKSGRGEKAFESLAAAGTLQLEFQYLSDVTGNPIYKEKAYKCLDAIYKMNNRDGFSGIFPELIDVTRGYFLGQRYSISGNSDSFYEYLLKVWISTGDKKFRDRYDIAVESILEKLLQFSTTKKHYFFPALDGNSGQKESTIDHLSCFAGAMFAMGAQTKKEGNWKYIMDIAANFTETCHEFYVQSPHGLGGESGFVNGDRITSDNRDYILRYMSTYLALK